MAGLAVLDVLFPEKGGRNGSDCHQKSWCDALAVLEGVETALRSAHTRYKSAAGQVLDYFGKDNRLPLLKLAALLHAVAGTDRADAGRIADGIGRRLKLSNRDRDYLTGLLAALDDVFIIAAGDSGRSVRVRFFRSSPNAGMGALVLGDGVLGADIDMIPAELDRRAGSQRLSQTIVDYYTRIRAKLAEKDLIGGTDLISSGILPGPSLGKILREVRRAQDEGTVASREDALRLALKISGRES
jgi:poly(A) polymerase